MKQHRKPLSTKKPPAPSIDHTIIEDWMVHQTMPGIQPLLHEIDSIIHDTIPNLQYAIKWGKAYYGTKGLGWLIEVAAYHVSANIVFLNGAKFDPPPPLGSSGQTRYIKIRSVNELEDPRILDHIQQSVKHKGWQ